MCWGDNEQGQVGKGDVGGLVAVPTAVASLDTYVEVSAGRRHCCAVRWDGTAWCWGANEHGQLGDGSKITALVPRPVKYLYGQQVAPLGHVANLALGATHTCAGDGLGLRCWGANLYGQLGDGTKVDKVLPAIVGGGMQISLGTDDLGLGAFHSLASLPHSDTLTSWGHNNAGQLGVDSTMDSSVPVTVTNYPCTTAQQAQKEPPPKFKGSFFTYGPELEPYEHPFAVAVDDVPQGRVFVSDTHAVRICRLEADGTGPLCWGSQCNLYDGYVGFPPGYGCVDPDGDGPLELGDGQAVRFILWAPELDQTLCPSWCTIAENGVGLPTSRVEGSIIYFARTRFAPGETKTFTLTTDVTLCHFPPGNRANFHTLVVEPDAADAHQRQHGDLLYLRCPEDIPAQPTGKKGKKGE